MKQRHKVLILLILLSSVFMMQGCGANNKPATKTGFMLDTNIEITAYGKKAKAGKAVNDAFNRVRDIDNKMSPKLPASSVVKINDAAGKDHVKVDGDTYYVIKQGEKYGKLTGGMFDISVAPLVNLWGIGTDKQRVPSQSEIDDALHLIDYKKVKIENDNNIMLPISGMGIDLGGIAKGYAADCAKQTILKDGIDKALINLGGNVYAVGSKTDGSDWRIGIQDPLDSKGNYVGIVNVKDKSVVTSGNYERFFEANGKRYHHIFDLSTGYPSDNGVISTTIISDKSITGDALSTSVYVLGVDKGLKLVESMDGIDAIMITSDKKIYATPGAKKIFKITNEEYTYEDRR